MCLDCYFVTVCTRDRKELFGKIVNNEIRLNEYGEIVNQCWNELPTHYCGMKPDAFVVMPNHIHAVIRLIDVGR